VIDEHDERLVRRDARPVGAGVLGVGGGDAPLRVDEQLAAGDELVEHVHRLREQPARVRAQVDDQRLHALRVQVLQRPLQLLAGRRGETDDAQIADPGPDHVRVGNALDGDLGALDRDAQGLSFVLAHDGHFDGRAGGPAQQLEDVVVGHALRERLLVDLGDAVARAQPEPVGRRALEG
jgi:hypothetical protein